MTDPAQPCRPEDLFEVSEQMPPADLAVLTDYLAVFRPPVIRDGERHCAHCGSRINAMMEALGLGAAFKWGVAHGEASLTCCGAPARGYHRITRNDGSVIAEFGPFYLEYLPEKDQQWPTAPRSTPTSEPAKGCTPGSTPQ